MLTAERLKELLSQTPVKTSIVISRDEYNARKEMLVAKSNQIIRVLKANHWPLVTQCMKGAKLNQPIVVLYKFFRDAISRTSDLVYLYLIDLYAILYWLQIIEIHVDNTIDWEEHEYPE